ncbi:MDR family MFS transporter [Candidatus Harpocratesius sp.]
MFTKLRKTYQDYPKAFWVLLLGTFIDRLGGFLLFPYFAIYIKNHFSVGMTEVGIIFTMFSIGSLLGGTIGGVLTDKYGRKTMLLVGLIISGSFSILMVFINNFIVFNILAILMGILGNTGSPAQQAMVADLLPPEKQAEGFGALRVAVNLSATIGPAIGGLLAAYSYVYLFIADALTSGITAIIVFRIIPETKPENQGKIKHESFMETFRGYKVVIRDLVYMVFLFISSIIALVYMQMNSTLSVFLLDEHGFVEKNFGLLLSMNALMVVLFQFWITRKISRFPPMIMMAVGAGLYAIGFSMYSYVSTAFWFFFAMGVITIGEMVISPFGQTVAAHFAPEDKRGRYMAIYSYSWIIPALFGTLGAGIIMDHYNPDWVWSLAGILAIIATFGFLFLHSKSKHRFSQSKTELDIEEIK